MAGSTIWDPVETLDRQHLRELQVARLQQTIDRILAAQPFGAERLRAVGINSPADVTTLEHLQTVEFTTKADLREHYPFGLLAVPRLRVEVAPQEPGVIPAQRGQGRARDRSSGLS